MGDNLPVGSNRPYARVGGDHTYDGWLAGLKAGNGFVTNGSMLTFEVDGHTSGDVVEFSGRRTVKVRATARSIPPFATLEIVLNGESVAIKAVSPQNSPPANGIFSVELETTLDLRQSSWLATRVAEDPDSKERILPRGLTVFAHTNPVYFLHLGAKVREITAIQYLQKYVRGTLHWLNTGAHFATAAEKEEALRLAHKAYRLYSGLYHAPSPFQALACKGNWHSLGGGVGPDGPPQRQIRQSGGSDRGVMGKMVVRESLNIPVTIIGTRPVMAFEIMPEDHTQSYILACATQGIDCVMSYKVISTAKIRIRRSAFGNFSTNPLAMLYHSVF